MHGVLSEKLRRASPKTFCAVAIAAAFVTYFCMYAFRKPYTAAHYDILGWGPDFKGLLVIAQTTGYAISKFWGIRFISELPRRQRAVALVGLIAIAEFALLVFAIMPPGGQLFAIFFNGLPLGMVWGLVFSYLEGRRTSELLGAGLSCSYIIAGGYVRAVGKQLMNWGVPEAWMPVATGAVFMLPFLLSVFVLSALPPPDAADEQARTKRTNMDRSARWAFFRQFAPGLVPLTMLYVVLTGYRDVRDNFQAEILRDLGLTSAATFAKVETAIVPAVLLALALIYGLKSNRRALHLLHGLMLGGTAMIGVSTLAFRLGLLDGLWWMSTVGIGLYLAYVPFGCVLFDRLIASQRVVATSVFMIYVTDAFGYVGALGLIASRQFAGTLWAETRWLDFFVDLSWLCSGVCSLCFAASWLYFARITPRGETLEHTEVLQ